MKYTVLHDQGDPSCAREDGLICSGAIFGVLDGTSAPHSPQFPPRKFFGNLTGGEATVRLIESHFANAFKRRYDLQGAERVSRRVPTLCRELRHVSGALAQFQRDAGLSLRDAGELAGASFAFVDVKGTEVEIFQGGDCLVFWEFEDGTIGVTPNQCRGHSAELSRVIEEIRKRVAWELFGIMPREASCAERESIRGEVWNRYRPILEAARRRDANNPQSQYGYAFLNGQKDFHNLLYRLALSRDKLTTILLSTDGAFPWEEMAMKTDHEVAVDALRRYRRGGLSYILAHARSIEKEIENENHVDAAEFTAIALEF